jgi:hypothetical protein
LQNEEMKSACGDDEVKNPLARLLFRFLHFYVSGDTRKQSNAGLQLRRAISIQAEGTRLLEKHAIAPSAARLCWTAPLKREANGFHQ